MLFFKSLFYFIIAIVILIILFFVGLILLVRGLLKKPLAEYAGSNKPKHLMIAGTVLLCLPLVAIAGISIWGISSSVSTIYNRAHYESISDVWRHESVSQSKAEDDIIKALLVSADNGSREAFSKNFTLEMQKEKGFDKAVDDFFAAYPVGLSKCKRNDKTRPDSAEIVNEATLKTDSLSFRCSLDGKEYFIILEYCYRNDGNSDKVGVTRFRVMNLEAAAVYYDDESSNAADPFPVCDIKSSSEYNARLVGGRAYLWTPTDTPKLSADQLRNVLEKTNRLDDPIFMYNIGEPNLIIKQDDSTEYGYFFQLNDMDGAPCYAYFQTDSERGNILWAFLCTPYEVDYDNPLVEYKETR